MIQNGIPQRGNKRVESTEERRKCLTRALRSETGIDEAMIEQLVRSFYANVQMDPLIGPVFAGKISDWEVHIAKLCAFWSSVTLMSGRYHGQPMQAHLMLPVEREHFERWLSLFEQTAAELCPPAAAQAFVDRARRISDSLQIGIELRRNGILSQHQV